MPFASMKNAEKRRSHKERAQPSKRRKLGLLEKHDDYVKRARNYASKRQRIRALQRKAAERNPDEFNFAMINSKTKNGVHVVSDSRGKLSADMHMLIKTQDLTYATMAQTVEKNKIEKLKSSLHCLGATSQERKHTIFVDDKKEQKRLIRWSILIRNRSISIVRTIGLEEEPRARNLKNCPRKFYVKRRRSTRNWRKESSVNVN